jgi:hypothetical protein
VRPSQGLVDAAEPEDGEGKLVAKSEETKATINKISLIHEE